MKAKILIFITLLCVCSIFAQEIAVRKANRIEFEGLHIRSSDNHTFVLWKDYVNARNDIAVQKINHLGEEQWESAAYFGVTGFDNYPVSAVRSTDGANIILWQTEEFPNRKLYLSKFDDDGESVWLSAPLMVYSGNDVLPSIKMIANSVGGVFIVYTEDFSSTSIMGINVDGNGNQLWNQNNQLLFNFENEVAVRSLHPDGEGGMIVNCWVQTPNWTSKTHLIRFSAQAEIVGNNPLIPEGSFSMMIKNCVSTSDGNLLLYSANLYADPTLYMQKIDIIGNPVGNLFSYPFSNSQACRELAVKASPNGGVIVAWRQSTDEVLSTKCQSFDSNLLPLWSPNGVVTNYPGYDYYDLELEPDAAGGAWLHSYGSIYYISPAGEAAFSQEGISFSNGYNSRLLIVAASNHLSIFWREEYNRSLSLRKQVINTAGDLLWGEGGTPIVSRLAGFAAYSNNYTLGDNYLCLWSDSRIGGKETKLFYQILDDEGQLYLEIDGRELNPGNDSQESLIRAQTLDGDKLAIFYHVWNVGSGYWLQVIDANGDPLIAGHGLELNFSGIFNEVKMSCYQDDIYLGWIEEMASETYRLKGQRISNLQKQWGEDGIVLVDFPQNSFASLSELQGRYYVFTVEDYNTYNIEARALLVEPSGTVSPGWNPLGVALIDSSVYNYQYCFRTTLLQDDLVAIIHRYQGVSSLALAQRITPLGICLWSDTGVLIPDIESYSSISIYEMDDQINLLHLTGYGPYILHYQRIDGDGNLQWDNGGTEIGSTPGFPGAYQFTGFDDGVMVAIYEKDGPQETYYGHYFDIAMKYISSEGIPALENPILCAAPYDQRFISTASQGDNSLISWTEYRAGVYSEDYAYSAIYARLITSEPIWINDPVLPPPAMAVLHQNYPNPFNPSTRISFSLDCSSEVSLQIFNLKGQLVKRLYFHETFLPGKHEIVWDGIDENLSPVSSGLYFYSLSSNGKTQVKKMLLTK